MIKRMTITEPDHISLHTVGETREFEGFFVTRDALLELVSYGRNCGCVSAPVIVGDWLFEQLKESNER